MKTAVNAVSQLSALSLKESILRYFCFVTITTSLFHLIGGVKASVGGRGYVVVRYKANEVQK